uniref:hypothetical protein n=1 Tax=Candidatus Enterococcus willemsii TaxID=1857215 RepID=UPI00403EF8D6
METNRLLIKNVQLFSTFEKKAKRIDFEDGINIITSNQQDGNKVGKSLILKSIYHTLGADSFFDSNLHKEAIIFIVQFSIKNSQYTMLRTGKFFKLFDFEYSLLLKTESATELAEKLYDIYSFHVYLPSRNNKKLTIAPPAYAYILNFIDQDKMHGSKFDSFDRLGQFTNYKENLLYCHFGLFNQSYFDLTIRKDNLSENLRTQDKELEIIKGMLNKINKEIPRAVPEDLTSLRTELNRQEEKYRKIYSNLKKTKDKLFRLRNTHAATVAHLHELKIIKNKEHKELDNVVNHGTCPTCSQEISDTLEIRLNKNINISDITHISLDLQALLAKTEKDISKNEKIYSEYLQKLNEYKKILRGSRKNQDEIIQI